MGLVTRDVCIVDDEPDLGRVCEDHLGTWFRVRSFLSAEDALWAMSDEGYAPDLVIVDIKMPGINGLDMLHRMNRNGARIPAIVMSAYADKQYALQAINEGVLGFLEKPFSLDQLDETIHKVLDQHRQIRDLERITSQFERLSRASLALNREFLNKHLIGEKFVMTNDLAFPDTPQSNTEFLAQLKDKKNLEKLIEDLGVDVQHFVSEYKKSKVY